MSTPCQFGAVQNASDATTPSSALPTRRRVLSRSTVGLAGLTCADFLGHFLQHGQPAQAKAAGMAADRTAGVDDPHFLIYWFLEGGWMGYDMFNPVVTDNNVRHRLDDLSRERYRVLEFGQDGYRIKRHGDIRYGYLAESGKPLFGDLAVLASMQTGTSHSSERLKAHMGSYRFRNTHERQEDERSVLQAFAEAYGQPYLLPHLSWHWWLSDGELNEAQYTGRRGYYHALGPVHAHTIYAGTPRKLKSMLMRMQSRSGSGVDAQVQAFLDSAHQRVLEDESNEAVKSYHSARTIYRQLAERGRRLNKASISQLFTDAELRSRFNVTPGDELITYRSVNGNKARSKFSPNTNVQAMMTYEMMRAGLSCAFWIESRDIRRFDSHRSRSRLWKKDGTPVGQADQTEMLRADLWQPLLALVDLLKTTEYGHTGRSLFDLTTIVLTSEFGRTIHGNVASIDKMKISDEEKAKKFGGQDISQHWRVTSSAFLGGRVKGGTQYGNAGQKTLEAIPLMPDGSMDPAYDPLTGELIQGRHKDERSFIPNHGHVYATALALSGLSPRGRGQNDRPSLEFIKKT